MGLEYIYEGNPRGRARPRAAAWAALSLSLSLPDLYNNNPRIPYIIVPAEDL